LLEFDDKSSHKEGRNEKDSNEEIIMVPQEQKCSYRTRSHPLEVNQLPFTKLAEENPVTRRALSKIYDHHNPILDDSDDEEELNKVDWVYTSS
jgi:hypothetical protein